MDPLGETWSWEADVVACGGPGRGQDAWSAKKRAKVTSYDNNYARPIISLINARPQLRHAHCMLVSRIGPHPLSHHGHVATGIHWWSVGIARW